MSTRKPEPTPKPEAAPDSFDPEERLKLWVRAGGRCAMCNTYVFEHEYTALNVNTGELAHIVGRVKSERSPRGEHPLPVDRRNLAENLVLLCPSDHTMIDKKLGQGIWTVADLQELKREHEDRIRYLTGLARDRETVVIRAVGDIRGAAVELAAESVRAAVHDSGRYPRYRLGVSSESDIEIDWRKLPREGSERYWHTAEEQVQDIVGQQLAAGVGRGHVRHLSLFAFARIPLLVMLGHHLDDKIPTDLYEHHRDELHWRWASGEPLVSFRFIRIAGEPGAATVTLVCSISGTVVDDALPRDAVDDAAVYELRPADAEPHTDLLRVPESLAAFSATYRAFLAHIEHEHPDAEMLNVLGALPLTAAVELGRRRTRNVHPPLRVWDRDAAGVFKPTVELRP